jgi:DegV family protein with EDD domain
MSKIIIVTDSASDISMADEKQYNIKMLPFTATLDGKDYVSRVDIDNEGFYKLMESSPSLPTHSQLTAFLFEELYFELFQQGYTDAILVLINSEGSATYNNAVQAYGTFLQEHPEADGKFKAHLFDSESYSGSYGYAVVEAGKMVKDGKSVEEINAFIRDWLDNVAIYFGVYTLKYAKKSGRIPSAAAFVGEALGLKPILFIDDHKITTAGKVRGEKNVIPAVINAAKAGIEPGSPYSLIYGSDTSLLQELKENATAEFGYAPSYIFQIGAVVAANAGPRLVAVIYRQKKK